MNKRLLGGIAMLLLAAGTSPGQTPPAPPPAALLPLLQAGMVPDTLPVLPASASPAPQTIMPAGPAFIAEGDPKAVVAQAAVIDAYLGTGKR